MPVIYLACYQRRDSGGDDMCIYHGGKYLRSQDDSILVLLSSAIICFSRQFRYADYPILFLFIAKDKQTDKQTKGGIEWKFGLGGHKFYTDPPVETRDMQSTHLIWSEAVTENVPREQANYFLTFPAVMWMIDQWLSPCLLSKCKNHESISENICYSEGYSLRSKALIQKFSSYAPPPDSEKMKRIVFKDGRIINADYERLILDLHYEWQQSAHDPKSKGLIWFRENGVNLGERDVKNILEWQRFQCRGFEI